MNQTRQGKLSTKNMAPLEDIMEEMNQAPGNDRTREVYIELEEVDGKLFSDQTGTNHKHPIGGKNMWLCFMSLKKMPSNW